MRNWTSKNKQGVFARSDLRSKKRSPRIASMIVFAISGFVASIILLAAWTIVPEVSRAPGEIVPTGNYVQIEALDGGQVVEVFVREGDNVYQGQVLAALSSVQLEREFERIQQELNSLDTWANNHKMILAALQSDGEMESSVLSAPGYEFAVSTLTLYRAQQKIDVDTINRLGEILRLQTQARERLVKRFDEKAQIAADLGHLLDRGLSTRSVVEAARDAVANTTDQIQALELRMADLRKEIAVLQAKLHQNTLGLRETYVEAQFEIEQQKRALVADKQAVQTRLQSLDIVAPESGVIQSVGFPNAGEVIEPGETLFELLPATERMVAVVRINTRDIGHIAVGTPAQLKLETYDNRRVAPVSGRISSISPNRVYDANTGEDYFRAIVELEASHVEDGKQEKPILSGMTVTSEIVTNERTMLAYILKPIERSFSLAFSER